MFAAWEAHFAHLCEGMMAQRFQKAMAALDAANAQDPVIETDGDESVPRALLYSRRMTACLHGLAPEAPETLRLAVHAQHLRRWAQPRADYPAGRAGYHRWRTDLAAEHARECGQIMRDAGYPEADVSRVQSLLRKENRETDPDCQMLEDTACLVFLRHYLDDFAAKHDRDKLLHVLHRTWRKMGKPGRQAAESLTLSPAAADLLAQIHLG